VRLSIAVEGRPAPQGSHDLGSAGQFLDSSPYLAAWRSAVRVAAFRAYRTAGFPPESLPLFPAGVPVVIEQLHFYVQPDQCRAAGTNQPTGKPDIDKLLRSTLDALGGARSSRHHARLFDDDSQVTEIRELFKWRHRAGMSGAFIVVSDGRD
jgi:Holliday junction resolvase RusA-like endonuclease